MLFRKQKKRYEIWSEGFAVTGESGGACLEGREEAYSFREAVEIYAKKNPGWAQELDLKQMTHWGCSLFDNEKKARKSFG